MEYKGFSKFEKTIDKNFANSPQNFYFCSGELAEWSNAAVLKTVNCNRFRGSNPLLSAEKNPHRKMRFFCFIAFRDENQKGGVRSEGGLGLCMGLRG